MWLFRSQFTKHVMHITYSRCLQIIATQGIVENGYKRPRGDNVLLNEIVFHRAQSEETTDYANAPTAHTGFIFKPVMNITGNEIQCNSTTEDAAVIMTLENLVNMYPEDIYVTASGAIVMSHGTKPKGDWIRNFIDVSAFSYIQAPCNSPYKEKCCFAYPEGPDWATICDSVKEIVMNISPLETEGPAMGRPMQACWTACVGIRSHPRFQTVSSDNIDDIVSETYIAAWGVNKEYFFNDVIKETIIPRDADRKSTRLNSSHSQQSRMPSSA